MRRLIARSILIALIATGASAQESGGNFQINLGEDGKTIGEMRPVFLEMSSQALPAISLKEVARRYQRLFEESEEPEVRIDALHRLTNLHSIGGEGLDLSPEQEEVIYREALKSYEMIVKAGRYQGRLDELLYQTAKAYAFIGNDEQSVQRLKQLVGLYPTSNLAPEARFRIAESAFSEEHFSEAEQAYAQVIGSDARADLQGKAIYMKGWSQYKQDKLGQASHTFLTVLDDYYAQSDGFTALDGGAEALVNDTFRILALMASRTGGAAAIDRMIAAEGGKPYDYLLYDRLGDYYLANERYTDSVQVNQYFIDNNPAHPRAPAMRAQIVSVWEAGGFAAEARAARTDFVAAYDQPATYGGLSEPEQAQWRSLADQVGSSLYAEAQATGSPSPEVTSTFASAGVIYDRLADVSSGIEAPQKIGEQRRLAGDAWLQAGREQRAIEAFEKAGYEQPGYDGAADSAWAAVALYQASARQSVAEAGSVEPLDVMVAALDRFATAYPGDSRLPAAEADLANQLLTAGDNPRAQRFAEAAVAHPKASYKTLLAGWLVIGQTEFDASHYDKSEQAYRQALASVKADSNVKPEREAEIRSQLALSIYRQGEAAAQQDEVDAAVGHFQRVAGVGGEQGLTIGAALEASVVLLKAERWQPAIDQLQDFRSRYPEQAQANNVDEKLVYAYKASGQYDLAANEILERSADSADPWPARIMAAGLLEQAGSNGRANMIYGDYLDQASDPASAEEHARQQSLRQKLIEADGVNIPSPRLESLVDTELASEWHSDKTLTWAAAAALVLAADESSRYADIRLTLPLSQTLAAKKAALQKALDRYQQAESLGGSEVKSQALFGRAELYRVLARDVMSSERPSNLTELELAQYDVLLEEQAYPFEEKAIDLHAANHQQIASGVYNDWVQKSMDALAALYPARYSRESHWMPWSGDSAHSANSIMTEEVMHASNSGS
ncbi:tetratricopeptide repeat protein [Marinobacter sp. V034]|uniref:tetratricopeptide repeat protein n=1 Tax=Marinobacter sp. V034 TaxID=3459610 RepID=UPI004044D19D